jgi:hypothetical protein
MESTSSVTGELTRMWMTATGRKNSGELSVVRVLERCQCNFRLGAPSFFLAQFHWVHWAACWWAFKAHMTYQLAILYSDLAACF